MILYEFEAKKGLHERCTVWSTLEPDLIFPDSALHRKFLMQSYFTMQLSYAVTYFEPTFPMQHLFGSKTMQM